MGPFYLPLPIVFAFPKPTLHRKDATNQAPLAEKFTQQQTIKYTGQ